jgi:hypothetical protein
VSAGGAASHNGDSFNQEGLHTVSSSYGYRPSGALLLVSDQPMVPDGVKTEASDARVSAEYVERHIQIGIEALRLIRRHGKSVRHLRFDE